MERITVFTDRTCGTIAPEVYGHFIEHLGRCIYDGIWVGKDSSIPNVDGIRQEAIDVLKQVRAPLIRWPGGYFADLYDWRDGIGPAADRPVRLHECEPGREEPNTFGTHEFMQLCELTGAEPNLCVNTVRLTPQDAMDWVTYCNDDGRSEYAQLRRKNGRQQPWNVKYWAIGNEVYFFFRPETYAEVYNRWRRFMRRADPKIQCIASMIEPKTALGPYHEDGKWLLGVAAGIRDQMELASLHLYSGFGGLGTGFTEEDYWNVLAQVDQRNETRIEAFLGVIDACVGDQRVKLALDEWGLWHYGANMTNNCEQACTHRDAVFAGRYFHMLQRHAKRIGLATVAQSVNVLHALLRTDGPRTYRTPTFHVFDMFKGHQGGTALGLVYTSPRHEIPDRKHVLDGDATFDVVSASASMSPAGDELLLTCTNGDLEKSYRYQVDIAGPFVAASGSMQVLAADPQAMNTFDDPDRLHPLAKPLDLAGGALVVDLPPCSVVAVNLRKA